MSTDNRNPFNVQAGSDLSASAYCAVTVNSSGLLALPSANGGIIGILYNKPKLNDPGEVMGVGTGIVKGVAGGTITLPTDLKVNASGQFLAASAADVAAGYKVGTALQGAVSGDAFQLVLTGDGQVSTAGDETVTSGALSATLPVSYVSVTGTQAYSLANGTAGQIKRIEVSVAASTPVGTLTITTPLAGDPSTYTLNAVGQVLTLAWKVAGGTAGWHLIGIGGEETITSGALSQWPVSYLSITGTQAYTLPNAMYEGQTKRIEVSLAASTPVGTLTITTPFTGEPATYVFSNLASSIEFVYRVNTGWHVMRSTLDETVTSGNINPFCPVSYLSVTGTQAYTLPNGSYDGQLKRLEVSVAASTPAGTVTITTPFTSEASALTMSALGQAVELVWRVNLGWHLTRRLGNETITTGAVSIETDTTLLSTTGTIAYTLANGQYIGQRKTIREITAASTPIGTLTITTTYNSEPTVYVFNVIGQEIELEWLATGWRLCRKIRQGATTVVIGTTVLTGFLLNSVYNLSVTGTVSSTGTKAIPAPTLPGEMIFLRTTLAASTPVGNINVAGFTAAQVAATNVAGINATSCAAMFISDGAAWNNTDVTTATYS